MEAESIQGVEEDVRLADVPLPPVDIRVPNGGELKASPCSALNIIVEHIVYYHEENIAHVLFSRVIAYDPMTRRHVLARLEARAPGSNQAAAFTHEELQCTPNGSYEFELQPKCPLTDVDVASMAAPPPANRSAYQMYKKIKHKWRFREDLTNYFHATAPLPRATCGHCKAYLAYGLAAASEPCNSCRYGGASDANFIPGEVDAQLKRAAARKAELNISCLQADEALRARRTKTEAEREHRGEPAMWRRLAKAARLVHPPTREGRARQRELRSEQAKLLSDGEDDDWDFDAVTARDMARALKHGLDPLEMIVEGDDEEEDPDASEVRFDTFVDVEKLRPEKEGTASTGKVHRSGDPAEGNLRAREQPLILQDMAQYIKLHIPGDFEGVVRYFSAPHLDEMMQKPRPTVVQAAREPGATLSALLRMDGACTLTQVADAALAAAQDAARLCPPERWMHATLALANGQSVTGRVKNSDVTRQSEMGVRVKPEAFANAPAVEYYHAKTGRRIDERDILQMSLPERAKFVVREGVAAQAGTSGDFGTPVAAAMLRTRRLICWAAWLDQIAKGDVDLQRRAAFMLVASGGRSGQAPFHVSVTGLETADEKLVLLKAFGVDLESADAKAVLDGSVDTFTHAWQADGTPFALATANIALFTEQKEHELCETMGWHDDRYDPLWGASAVSLKGYNLQGGDHVANLHSDQEVEACALMGSAGVRVYKDYDDQGEARRHDLSTPKRMLQRTPKTRACATFPVDAAGTRHGSCTAEDLAHRVHASLPAAIADGSWGDGDGMTALKRGSAARSGFIFRGSMQTAAQFLRGEEDFEMTREQKVRPRKLFSPKQNLRNHLKGSDETHGALLELTDDMADVAGGLSKYDGTLFEKHGLARELLAETLALAMNAGHRARHARDLAKNVAASTPQPVPDGPVPPGIAKLAAELRRSKDDGIGACADSSTASTLENVIHTVVANGVPPRLILEADEAARAAASLPAEAAPSLPSSTAITPVARLASVPIAAGLVESTITDILLLLPRQTSEARSEDQGALLQAQASDVKRTEWLTPGKVQRDPAKVPSALNGLEVGSALVAAALEKTKPTSLWAGAQRAYFNSKFWLFLQARSTWADALASRDGRAIEWEFGQAKLEFRSQQLGPNSTLPGVTKSRYQVATIKPLEELVKCGKDPATFFAEGSSWSEAEAKIAAVVKGKGADDFMVTKNVLNHVLHGSVVPLRDTGCPLGPGARDALWSIVSALRTYQFKLARKVTDTEVDATILTPELVREVVDCLRENVRHVAMAYWRKRLQREPRLALVQEHVEALINRRFSTPSIEGMLCEVLLRRQAALAWARGEGKPGTCDPTKSTFDLGRAIATVHAYEGNLLDAARVLDLTDDGHIVAIRVAELIERMKGKKGMRKRRSIE